MSFVLNNFGEVARTEGDYQEARKYYEESESILRMIGDRGDLARLVHNLGAISLHRNDLAGAEACFDESLAMFIKLGNQRGIAECLASMAGEWAKRGRKLEAVTLLGAAQALLDATGASWWPADRGEVEGNLESLRGVIERAQFDTAWQAGGQMSLKSALQYVREREEK
jgi:tetratricopeptide (TPR) repeat protein